MASRNQSGGGPRFSSPLAVGRSPVTERRTNISADNRWGIYVAPISPTEHWVRNHGSSQLYRVGSAGPVTYPAGQQVLLASSTGIGGEIILGYPGAKRGGSGVPRKSITSNYSSTPAVTQTLWGLADVGGEPRMRPLYSDGTYGEGYSSASPELTTILTDASYFYPATGLGPVIGFPRDNGGDTEMVIWEADTDTVQVENVGDTDLTTSPYFWDGKFRWDTYTNLGSGNARIDCWAVEPGGTAAIEQSATFQVNPGGPNRQIVVFGNQSGFSIGAGRHGNYFHASGAKYYKIEGGAAELSEMDFMTAVKTSSGATAAWDPAGNKVEGFDPYVFTALLPPYGGYAFENPSGAVTFTQPGGEVISYDQAGDAQSTVDYAGSGLIVAWEI